MSDTLLGLCQHRSLLLETYRETVKAYSDAVHNMVDLAYSDIGSDLDVLRRASRRAWEATEKARLALFRHEADHCCDRPGSTPLGPATWKSQGQS